MSYMYTISMIIILIWLTAVLKACLYLYPVMHVPHDRKLLPIG